MLGSRIASTTVLVTALLAWTMPETQARFTPIVTYAPMTKVTDVAALDLDQNELERQLGLGALNNARAVYERGGNSLSIANLTLVNPPGPMSYPQGTQVLGRTKGSANTTVLGILVDESVTWGALPGNVTIHVQYVTSTNQTTYSDCQSGGLWTFREANLNGCYNDQGHVTLVPPGESANRGDKLAYKYDIRQDNWNLRTLQSLSTNADTSMRPCPGCPFYADFQTFVNYYETTEYADSWIMAAALNRSVAFPSGRGNANFGAAFTSGSKLGLAEAVKKGTAYMSVFMQIIRDLEDAMTDCDNKCDPDDLSCQDIGAEAVHSLDAAVALYAGSLEGTDGTENSGVMPYALANRRAADFRTGGPQGERSSGTAHVNYEVIKEFKHAQTRLLADECNLARQNKWRIVNLMKVPLVQGVLRYAYMRDFNNPSDAPTREKEQAEGATFAAALLPFVHKCDTADATLIYNNMRIGSDANKVVFADVKAALERNYGCMGISCPLVGGFHNGQDYERGATPCTEGTLQGPAAPDFSQLPSSSGGSGGGNAGVAVGWILAVCLAGVVGFMAYRRFGKRKNIADVMKPPANNLAAVSEIA